jgi:glycosyltransferase involved in cell wall biosynthesis
MTRSLKILMIIHTPWSQNLGASRVPIELAEEFRELGDTVEKFSYEDAFPKARRPLGRSVLNTLMAYAESNQSFAARAEAFVRQQGTRFDIIDANHTDLSVPKTSLGFKGLLVARSVGLIPAYADFERLARKRWREGTSGRDLIHKALTIPGRRRRLQDVEKSFRHADVINVSNRDDFDTVSKSMGYGEKVVYFPFGLSRDRLNMFAASRQPANQRLKARTVAFIGTWNSRKGARDWPQIFTILRQLVPNVELLLLGTGVPEEHVLNDFPSDIREAVRVVPHYESRDLPQLLASATVGAFPGYLEGFGFGTLEMLAAGLPTVTYDAPGSRDILGRLKRPTMVPVGDTDAFARLLAELLLLTEERYIEHVSESDAVARTFSWCEIAAQTRATYLERLAELRTP